MSPFEFPIHQAPSGQGDDWYKGNPFDGVHGDQSATTNQQGYQTYITRPSNIGPQYSARSHQTVPLEVDWQTLAGADHARFASANAPAGFQGTSSDDLELIKKKSHLKSANMDFEHLSLLFAKSQVKSKVNEDRLEKELQDTKNKLQETAQERDWHSQCFDSVFKTSADRNLQIEDMKRKLAQLEAEKATLETMCVDEQRKVREMQSDLEMTAKAHAASWGARTFQGSIPSGYRQADDSESDCPLRYSAKSLDEVSSKLGLIRADKFSYDSAHSKVLRSLNSRHDLERLQQHLHDFKPSTGTEVDDGQQVAYRIVAADSIPSATHQGNTYRSPSCWSEFRDE